MSSVISNLQMNLSNDVTYPLSKTFVDNVLFFITKLTNLTKIWKTNMSVIY